MYMTFVHHFFVLLTFSWLAVLPPTWELHFHAMGGPLAIVLYQRYIVYLEDVIIYNMKRELAQALTSPDPPSSATTTVVAPVLAALVDATRRTTLHPQLHPLHLHLHPYRGTTTCRPSTPVGLCSSGSTRTTRLQML
jgi:hypothetical protein